MKKYSYLSQRKSVFCNYQIDSDDLFLASKIDLANGINQIEKMFLFIIFKVSFFFN